LAAIRDALANRDQESAWHLQKQAAAQFAELNGWWLSPNEFGIDAIGWEAMAMSWQSGRTSITHVLQIR
jgi:hypothetical protein